MSSFRVQGQLGLDGSNFFGTIERARYGVGRFQSAISSVGMRLAGMFSIGAITIAARRTMEYAHTIDETASRLGVGTDAMQEWSFAAKQAGIDTGQLTNFIEKLTAAAVDMKNANFWKGLGVNPAQTPENLFRSVQAKTQGKAPSEIIGMLSPIMDVRRMGPMINLLASDLNATSEQARKLGAVIDQATLKQLANLNDQLSAVSQILMAQFAPALLNAGIAAMTAFKGLAASASWAGARTANWQLEDWAAAGMSITPGPAGVWGNSRLRKTIQQGNEMGLQSEAEKAWDAIMKELRETIAKLRGYRSPEVPKIVPVGNVDLKPRTRPPSSDSLLAVGNFLGASRGNYQMALDKQLLELREIKLNTLPLKNLKLNVGFVG